MNRLDQLFAAKKKNILNIYFTAGYPQLEDTEKILAELQQAKVDIVEIGIPYSDPLADGETIQDSSSQALNNGITLSHTISQIKSARLSIDIPIVVMGYYNQFLQYGMTKLLTELQDAGVDGMIIPDLPMDYYKSHYQELFKQYDIKISFLITPETTQFRIKEADALTTSFLYVVAQTSITGGQGNVSDGQSEYFQKIKDMHLSSPTLIGFGIHNRETYNSACGYANGAIIGSAFIRMLKRDGVKGIGEFVDGIKL